MSASLNAGLRYSGGVFLLVLRVFLLVVSLPKFCSSVPSANPKPKIANGELFMLVGFMSTYNSIKVTEFAVAM